MPPGFLAMSLTKINGEYQEKYVLWVPVRYVESQECE